MAQPSPRPKPVPLLSKAYDFPESESNLEGELAKGEKWLVQLQD